MAGNRVWLVLDLSALFLIWFGTVPLIVYGIPAFITLPITDDVGQALTDEHGVAMIGHFDDAAQHAYFNYAYPATIAITIGIFIQGWSRFWGYKGREA